VLIIIQQFTILAALTLDPLCWIFGSWCSCSKCRDALNWCKT